MTRFVAKRVRFRNGERHTVLSRPGGLPVHEATLYLAKYRKRGLAANTIHAICVVLALLYRELAKADIDLLERFRQGRFLTAPELNRLSEAAQYRVDDLSDEDLEDPSSANVIDIRRIRLRGKAVVDEVKAVAVTTQVSRLRYMADFLGFLAMYVGATLPAPLQRELARESANELKAFLAQVPRKSRRVRLGAREGLSKEDQDRLLRVIYPNSPDNPWERGFVRQSSRDSRSTWRSSLF